MFSGHVDKENVSRKSLRENADYNESTRHFFVNENLLYCDWKISIVLTSIPYKSMTSVVTHVLQQLFWANSRPKKKDESSNKQLMHTKWVINRNMI
jgi:hypothetical protein